MSLQGPIDVFVVFAAPDRDRAAALCRALRANALRVFSRHALRPGDKWDEVLPERLRAARAVVVLISARWGEGHYGPEDVAIAIDHARKTEPPPRLIPVWLDGAFDRTPYGLKRVSGVRVAEGAFEAAAVEIAATLDPTATEPPPPRPPDAVTASRDRLEALRADGARPDTLDDALEDHLAARRAARDGAPPQAGDLFAGRYRLIDRLGDGGFATVWHARDQQRGGRVAVKILHGRWRNDRSRIERFERGAHRMAALDHPAIVRVLEAPSSHDGLHYYVMEHMPGGDLAAARTRTEVPLTIADALAAVLAVADALAEVHRRGMVHRDIKPQNIMLDKEGRAKLSDFDLVGADDSTGGTRTGALGTFLFAAPEALESAKDAKPTADVYGLAVTTLFALRGDVPADVVRRPDAVVDDLDAAEPMRALLRRSLAWAPNRRPPDAATFAAELREALAANADEPLRSTRRRVITAAAVAVAVVIVIALFAWLWPTRPEPITIVAGKTRGGAAPRLVYVSAGSFMMGAAADEAGAHRWDTPRHSVTITRDLWVAEFEVTQSEWQRIMGTSPSFFDGCDDCPVERVSWYEAAAFANRLSAAEGLDECYVLSACGPGEPGSGCPDRDGEPAYSCFDVGWGCRQAVFAGLDCLGYRLPTEAEWEYFTRAGTETRYWSGDTDADASKVGWHKGVTATRTKPVGSKAPNGWGLYDVHGNVREWVGDLFGDYPVEPVVDPVEPRSGTDGRRATRGGSYAFPPSAGRSAGRARGEPNGRYRQLGFRIVRTAHRR